MFYGGMPIYYYLQKLNMGKCKEYYETNYVPFAYTTLILTHKSIDMSLDDPTIPPEDYVFYNKLKLDLPDIDKVPTKPTDYACME